MSAALLVALRGRTPRRRRLAPTRPGERHAPHNNAGLHGRLPGGTALRRCPQTNRHTVGGKGALTGAGGRLQHHQPKRRQRCHRDPALLLLPPLALLHLLLLRTTLLLPLPLLLRAALLLLLAALLLLLRAAWLLLLLIP